MNLKYYLQFVTMLEQEALGLQMNATQKGIWDQISAISQAVGLDILPFYAN